MNTTGNQPSTLTAEAVDDAVPAPPADPQLVQDLVTANRILFARGVLDAFGHVSVRHDKQADRFLLARNMAPALVTAEDLVEFDLDGNAVNAGGRRVYLERFIHGEIYRARPDVMSVVHSHSVSVIPFGVVRAPLRAVCHMSGFLSTGAPVFEIRDEVQGSNMLITDRQLGAALARTLGDQAIVLMRGHGSTVVADGIRKAVFRAVYAEVNARIQAEAMRFGGEVTYLDAAEADAARDTNEMQAPRAWELWQLEAEAARRL